MTMIKAGTLVLLAAGFLCVFPLSLFATATIQTEELVISTYYPSPAGSYAELRAERMAIGDTFYLNSKVGWDGLALPSGGFVETADVSLLVEGRVGIGTSNPQSMLDVAGNIQIDSGSQDNQPVVWTDEGVLAYCTSFDNSGICNNPNY